MSSPYRKWMILGLFSSLSLSNLYAEKSCLSHVYPETLSSVSKEKIVWKDGSTMPIQDDKTNKTKQEVLDNPTLYDQLNGPAYIKGMPADGAYFSPFSDPGRIRYEPFFMKMYGGTQEEVESHLMTVYWMPHVFGFQYPLQVTQVNGVNRVFEALSEDLEQWVVQHPEDLSFLINPAGTFCWRKIANTNRQSMHSFGMTIDLASALTEYWQKDLAQEGRPITEDEPLVYRNHLPWGIVQIFEAHGFIWGGKWVHYDTQHFEYRPELLCS